MKTYWCNKKICLIMIFIILLSNIVTATTSAESTNLKCYQPDEYIIVNVPYVSQQTGYYCDYASTTMLFKHCGVNTSLEEVLFLTGVGYSLGYKGVENGSLAHGVGLCREFKFVSRLYNLTENFWSLDITNKSIDYCWNEYWMRVKQNISQNIPVKTAADPLYLKSIRDICYIPDKILDAMLGFLSLDATHAIVVVGYNEDNNTVCINEPVIGAMGYPELGSYCWMNLSVFKQAVLNGAEGARKRALSDNHMFIYSYEKNGEPLPKNQIFEQGRMRNIEKMKGNISAYGKSAWFNASKLSNTVGVKALEKLREEFQPNLMMLLSTSKMYKNQNMLINIIMKISKFFGNLLTKGLPDRFYVEQFVHPYSLILMDKEFNLKFLHENQEVQPVSHEELLLFEEEFENWTRFYDEYNVFVEKGKRLSNIIGMIKVCSMGQLLDNIIEIQHKIIEL